jgi:hypothetical protein
MGKTKGPYREEFPKGSTVRIADHAFLEDFLKSWKLHHSLDVQQLSYGSKTATVKSVFFYHGGDDLYELDGVPGIWHEQCLTAAPPEGVVSGEPPGAKRRPGWWWLALVIFILIPIRLGHWWLTAISLIVCGMLAWLLIAPD